MKQLALTIGNQGSGFPPVTVATPPKVRADASILLNTPQFIVTLLIGFVMVAAIAMIIISGIQWITSGGDAKKIEGARARLTYAIVGLVIAIAAVFIVGMVIRLLGGDPNFFNIGNFFVPNPYPCPARGPC